MDTLRASLEILFTEMRPEAFLNKEARVDYAEFRHSDKGRGRFNELLLRKFKNLSWDQCNLSAKMVGEFYMKKTPDPWHLAFAHDTNVFNTLLHFSGKVLWEKSGRPICRFEHLLRWSMLTTKLGEDLFTTSFLASKDAFNSVNRTSFDWELVIDQDDPTVSALLSSEMADVHLHLKGSSCNFDLSWLCLMNYPKSRQKQFQKMTAYKRPVSVVVMEDLRNIPMYALALKASAIRYYLYLKYVLKNSIGDDLQKFVEEIVFSQDFHTVMLANELDSLIRAESVFRVRGDDSVGHDYIWPVCMDKVKQNPNCILNGERYLLYSCFKACYQDSMPSLDNSLFYAYVLIKNRIRNELIQSNDVVGFHNFDDYESRKTWFIKDYRLYEELLEPLAIGQCFYHGRNRYVEPRIVPKSSKHELVLTIKKLDSRISVLSQADKSKYHYVLHFIKSKDRSFVENELINPRHNFLRNNVRNQAQAIHEVRVSSTLQNRIVGIDAANSEIYARPEVFAQAFRYLREMPVLRKDGLVAKHLGQSYHVGEDFLSPLDGLRAIDEVLHFLQFRRGDRLGHAIVLGIDPDRYFNRCHRTLLLPKIIVLDDLAWCLTKMTGVPALESVRGELVGIFENVFREVYGISTKGTVLDYYQSWLLRGDNPMRYQMYFHMGGVDNSEQLTDWSHYDLNDEQAASAARQNDNATRLYHLYHFNSKVRVRGEQPMEVNYPKGIANLVAEIQKRLMEELISLNISIETNPTSNFKIGGFDCYVHLPVHSFFPLNPNISRVSTSVNTDDRGVFDTSIEREFALLACALYKGAPNDNPARSPIPITEACDWLDQLRRHGLMQRFCNIV